MLEKRQRLLTDHAPVHDPDPLGLAELLLNLGHDRLDRLQILGIARQRPVRQREAVAGDHQRQDDLLAVATVVPRVAAQSQFVLDGQALEVGAGQVVEQQVVIELEESPEPVLQGLLDCGLGGQQAIERPIEPVLGHGAIGDAEQLLQTGRGVPVLGQGELAAGSAEAVDDLDGHDVGGPHRFLALRQVAVHDLVEPEKPPEPEGQPDVAESSAIGPADRSQSDANHIGIVGCRNPIVVGEEAKLPGVSLAVVDDHGALPATLLVMVELAEVGDDVLAGSRLGAHALDQGVIGVGLAVFIAAVAAQEHAGLLTAQDGQGPA